jgi:hypothetical protein
MPSIIETRAIINYLHGMDINADLGWVLNNYGEITHSNFLIALGFYEQMYNEYSIIAQLNIFLKIYLILFIINQLTENNVDEINGVDLNMTLVDYIHNHSSLNSVNLLNLIYQDFGINMNDVTNDFLEPNFQTEEEPAPLFYQLILPPNLTIDYIALYNDDGFDSESDEEMENNDLQLVGNLAINNPVDVSECPLCNETVIYPQDNNQLPPGFCRVNCPRGHTFHCWCINQWTNQINPTTRTYQNSCPICRQIITQMMNIQPPPQPPQPNGFGKIKFDIKEVNSDIKFLLKK